MQLIFSRDYPYKNFLRQIAPRFLIDHGGAGLNAYTQVDTTCYTFSSASVDGAMRYNFVLACDFYNGAIMPLINIVFFLRFLGIFLNQMLYPSLTDGDLLTEAHHITATGEDGGVVYSEMKVQSIRAGSINIEHLLARLEAQKT